MAMFSMWGWTPETAARIQAVSSDPEVVAESKARREAEKKVDEAGVGECTFCTEEIVKNERGLWESEFLVEYCIDAKDHKHRPKIVWKVADEPI